MVYSNIRPALWAICGIPATILSFSILTDTLIPIGGGTAHLLFAYAPTGNLAGIRTVFTAYLLAEFITLVLLTLTRYPGPWYTRAILVAGAAELSWLPFVRAPGISEAFRTRGIIVALTLAIAPFLIARLIRYGQPTVEARVHTIPFLRPALLWTLRTAIVWLVLWTTLISVILTLIQILEPSSRPVWLSLSEFFLIWVFGLVSNTTLAFPAFLAQPFVLWGWLYLAHRYPSLDATRTRQVWIAFGLAIPMMAGLAYTLWSSMFMTHFSWPFVLGIAAIIVISCWTAVFWPRWRQQQSPA